MLRRGWIFALGLLLGMNSVSRADFLINNGGFESGFTNWTRVDQLGSEGTFFQQSGTASPVLGDPVPAPPGGKFAAMTDAGGPGSHVLYQDFVVPTAGIPTSFVKFDLFIGNRATPVLPTINSFFSPNTLAFDTPTLNQQARVDIITTTADPFSLALTDVLLNLYQTKQGDPIVAGYFTVITDVTALLRANTGRTLRLRFAEVDNVNPFQFGVDNVSLVTGVPEPATMTLLGIGAGTMILMRRRKKPGAVISTSQV